MIKVIIGLAIGFVSGGFVGYLHCKNMLETQYQKDLDDVKELYENKIKAKENTIAAFDDVVSEKNKEIELGRIALKRVEKSSDDKFQKTSLDSGKEYRKIVTNYNKPPLSEILHPDFNVDAEDDSEEEDLDGYSPDELQAIIETEEEVAREREERMSKVDRNEAYVIDHWQFTEEEPDFDKLYLYYYMDDDVVCDDNDVIIEDPESGYTETVGWDFFNVLETQMNAWVRNERIRTDFCIRRMRGSYAEEVASREETDRERERRQRTRHDDK